jgi:hypothetical protein
VWLISQGEIGGRVGTCPISTRPELARWLRGPASTSAGLALHSPPSETHDLTIIIAGTAGDPIQSARIARLLTWGAFA